MSRNIVLLCLDTVRFDYFQDHLTSLNDVLDTFLEECRAASTWSVPSHASIFTGTLPSAHGFHSATPDFASLNPDETFLSNLEGYHTVGISANPYASPIFGFDTLFDEFHHVDSSMPFPEGISPARFWHESSAGGVRRYLDFLVTCLRHDHPLKSLANGTISQLENLYQHLPLARPFDDGCKRILAKTHEAVTDADAPTFVFANVMDVHGPLMNVRGYDQSLLSKSSRRSAPDLDPLQMTMDQTFDEYQPEITAYRELYAAAVEYTTRQVADFLDSLDTDTAVVITSDHGEQLDDAQSEDRFGHVTPDMTEALLHVPCAIVNSGIPIDESQPMSQLDLGGLITSIATNTRFEPEHRLMAETAGVGVAHPPTDHEAFAYWNRTSRCVYLDDAKYVWDSLGNASKYVRSDDGFALETEGEWSLLPEEATDPFPCDISEVSRTDRDREEVDDHVLARLEELGYR